MAEKFDIMGLISNQLWILIYLSPCNRDQMSTFKNATRPAEHKSSLICLIHLPSALWCQPNLVQYLLTQNKAFQSTMSEKSSHVQHTAFALHLLFTCPGPAPVLYWGWKWKRPISPVPTFYITLPGKETLVFAMRENETAVPSVSDSQCFFSSPSLKMFILSPWILHTKKYFK